MGTLKVIGSALYQWEIGRKIRIDASVGNRAVEVQFAHPGDKEALSVTPKEENGVIVAEVPNIMLQSGDKLIVFLVEMDENCVETTRHSVFHVVNRPKPADYLYTETEILSYRTLEQRIDQIEENGVSDEQIATAVEKYLDKNPSQGGATEEEKKQIQQNKTDIEKLTQDKLDAEKLDEAINEALAQAKESGEFKGEKGEKGDPGEPGYTPQKNIDYFDGKDGKDGYTPQKGIDYFDGKDGQDGKPGADGKTPVKGEDYFTPEEVQAIAEQAAEMVEVPSGGTMQPLTFTGAVNATYDGSEAVSVEIPQGGGGGTGGNIKVMTQSITLEEEVNSVTIDLDEVVYRGKVWLYYTFPSNPTFAGNKTIAIIDENGKQYHVGNGINDRTHNLLTFEIFDGWVEAMNRGYNMGGTLYNQNFQSNASPFLSDWGTAPVNGIKSLRPYFGTATTVFPAGTKFYVMAVKEG